jgi:threonine dehydrogenase-like Zn-dependent dehydrogenase
MQALTVTPGLKGSAQLAEIRQPSPKSSEVLLRIMKLGIDGTDRDINDGLYGAPPDGEKSLVVGHEALGAIVSVGQDVKNFAEDELVVPTVRRPCPENCLNCRNGESDMCQTGHYHEHGIYKLHGFASETAVSNAEYLVKVPRELADVAVLLEPTSIVEKAITQAYEIQERMNWAPQTALMLGAGPIGQLGTILLRLRGLEVYTLARRPKDDLKAQLVEATGAHYVNAKETSLDSLGKNFDMIFEGTGNAPLAMSVMNHLATNGVLCYLGVYGPSERTFKPDFLREVVLRNKLAFGSVNANKRYFEMGLNDFKQIKATFGNLLSKLLTSSLKPEDFEEAFRPSEAEIKTVIDFT